MRNRKIKTTLTPEQLKFEKENRTMGVADMAKIFGIPRGTLSYNRWVIKQSEIPPADKRYFDIVGYCKELVTI